MMIGTEETQHMAEKQPLLAEQRREAAEAEWAAAEADRASAEEQRQLMEDLRQSAEALRGAPEAEKVHLLEARLERLEQQVQGSLHAIHDSQACPCILDRVPTTKRVATYLRGACHSRGSGATVQHTEGRITIAESPGKSRQVTKSARRLAEEKREAAEAQRVQDEQRRMAEEQRQLMEEIRQTTETLRVVAEQLRERAEAERRAKGEKLRRLEAHLHQLQEEMHKSLQEFRQAAAAEMERLRQVTADRWQRSHELSQSARDSIEGVERLLERLHGKRHAASSLNTPSPPQPRHISVAAPATADSTAGGPTVRSELPSVDDNNSGSMAVHKSDAAAEAREPEEEENTVLGTIPGE